MDPAAGELVEFDITDPEFLENYFEIVHHPLEEEGLISGGWTGSRVDIRQ